MVSNYSEGEIRYPMNIVTQRTGLSSHVVRVWERRYEAVTPERSETNRRLYSASDIHRLGLLARLTGAGHSISRIARLETTALERIADELPPDGVEELVDEQSIKPHSDYLTRCYEQAWQAIADMDSDALQRALEEATRELGGSSMIENLIVPLAVRIGEGWESGEISVAQERVASTVIQEVLLLTGRPHSETSGAPNLLVVTPVGQLHRLGAALVVCTARRRGWAVTDLGTSIPAGEIAHAAKRKRSIGVALSIVYPSDDPGLGEELKRLRRLLGDNCSILAGGRASAAYAPILDEIGAQQFGALDELKEWLDTQRRLRELASGDSEK